MRSLNRSHAPESNIRGSAFSRAKSTPVEKVTAGLMIRTSRWAQKTAYFGFAHGESE
jgi:hypothetical protein